MTYTHGETTHASETITARITTAQQKSADLQAALRLQQLEEANTRTAAALQASEQRTAQALAALQERRAAQYPIDPNWRQHRATLDKELRAWKQRRGTSALPRTEPASV